MEVQDVMSYAGYCNLITLQLADSSSSVDSRLKRMLATSLVVHAVLLLGLMSVRFSPTFQQPLASYQVELVTLPEPRAIPSTKKLPAVKKATVPPPSPPVVEPAPVERVTPSIMDAVDSVVVPQAREITPMRKVPVVTPAPARIAQEAAPPQEKSVIPPPVVPPPSPPVVEPAPVERVTPSIMDAVDSVVVPQARKITPMVDDAPPVVTQSPVQSVKKNVETRTTPLPVVPQAPRLSTRRNSPKETTPLPSAPPARSMAETLKQAVQSVAVPQKSQTRNVRIPSTVQSESEPISPEPKAAKRVATEVASPRITTPGHAPQLAQVTPVPKASEVQPTQRPRNRVSDSLKQVLESVVVPEVRNPQPSQPKIVRAVPVPVPPPVRDTQPKPRKKLDSIVMPANAPKLAAVDLANARKAMSEQSVAAPPQTVQPGAVEQTIAKLPIPDVHIPETHHILSKPTDSGMQNTTTTLQVSGSSPEGNAYWGRVWSKIDREWIAPPVDVPSGQPLRVVLSFRVERNGAVKNLAVEQSSGNEYYDVAAKRAVLDAAPLPPFASDMPEPYYDIQFQFTVKVDS